MTLYSKDNSYPAPLPQRIRLADGSTRTDPATFTSEEIAAAGYIAAPPAPEYDPLTEQLSWIQGQWIIEPLEILSKRWPDAEAFVAEFTFPEMEKIGLSTEPTIAALRFLLSSWRSQVISDDPRVQAGLDALVQTAIISEQRRAEILS
jgi:hypothetical protein